MNNYQRLLDAADDNELDVIVRVAEKAGILWNCDDGSADPCNYRNDEDDDHCKDCGRAHHWWNRMPA